jgi:hypothetical protein
MTTIIGIGGILIMVDIALIIHITHSIHTIIK